MERPLDPAAQHQLAAGEDALVWTVDAEDVEPLPAAVEVADPSARDGATGSGARSRAARPLPGCRMRARSMTLRSSRTLPGQG